MWKRGVGKHKSWKTIPLTYLAKRRHQLHYEYHHWGEYLSPWIVRKPRLDQIDLLVSAASSETAIPRDMLRRYERERNTSSLNFRCCMSRHVERRLEVGCKNVKPYRLKSSKTGKRVHHTEVKETISEGISLHCNQSLSNSDFSDAECEDNALIAMAMLSQAQNATRLIGQRAFKEKAGRYLSSALTIPYESHLGAVIAGHFILRGCIRAKTCYEEHSAEDLNTNTEYFAKAYAICGTKGKEREHRLTSLKRNAIKATCAAAIDQNRKNGLFFLARSHPEVESDVLPSCSPWLGEQLYQHHFPGLSPSNTTINIRQKPLLKYYASCIQSSHIDTEDSSTHKKRRARDRQRHQRKEKRAAKAATRQSLEAEEPPQENHPSLVDDSLCSMTSIETSTSQHDVGQRKKEQDSRIGQEPKVASRDLSTPPSVPVAGSHDSDVALLPELSSDDGAATPADLDKGESPGKETNLRQHHHLPKNHSKSASDLELLEPDEFKRYLHFLDSTTRCGRYYEEDLWQELISGPPIDFKSHFFGVLGEHGVLLENAGARVKADSAKPQREQDLSLISRFLRAAALNQESTMYPQRVCIAFEDILQDFLSGDERGSRAMRLLCDGGHEKVGNDCVQFRNIVDQMEVEVPETLTCKTHSHRCFTELIIVQTS